MDKLSYSVTTQGNSVEQSSCAAAVAATVAWQNRAHLLVTLYLKPGRLKLHMVGTTYGEATRLPAHITRCYNRFTAAFAYLMIDETCT